LRAPSLLVILLATLAPGVATSGVPPGFSIESAAPGAPFDTPTGIAFLPGGRLLVAEKRGRVIAVENGVKRPTPMWSGESEVLNSGDRGLLDVAVDPGYVTNHYIYLLYAVDPNGDGNDDDGVAFGRLTRYRVSFSDSNVVDPASRTVLLGATWAQGPLVGAPTHTIGSMRFGEDGSLLVSVGDGASYSDVDAGGLYPDLFLPGRGDPSEDIGAFRAQYLSSLDGKILRIDPATGLGYPSNPYYDGNASSVRSKVWAYGFRNPFRFAVKPGSGSPNPAAGDPGVLYVGDVGWGTWEEIDVVTQPGQNFGWPCYEGSGPHPDYQSASPAHQGCGTIGTPANPAPARAPTAVWHHTISSLSTPPGLTGNCSIGGVFYTGNRYPAAYHNRYFYADYGNEYVNLLLTDASDELDQVQSFGTSLSGPVDLVADPTSGDVYYVAIEANEVRRIRYLDASPDNAPIAVASATPAVGVAPLSVQFSSADSYHPLGLPFTIQWLFGDLTGSTAANPQHTYTLPGVYRAVLTLEDATGAIGRDTAIVVVNQTTGFPTTGVLDNFNRPDGPLDAPWVGGLEALSTAGGALATGGDGWAVWSATDFGPTQEAYVRLDQITGSATEHDLELKVQNQAWYNGHIEVRYDATLEHVVVSTFTPEPGPGWQSHGAPFPVTLLAGDQLGARAYANGVVEVYVNGGLIGSVSVADWPFATQGGGIGLTLSGATDSRLDDFGGGDAVVSQNSAPHVAIDAPADGSFFVTGDTLRFLAHAFDANQPANTLGVHWQIDLHHDTHVHPASYGSTSDSLTLVAANHEDGRGFWYEGIFVATDQEGLSDTARVSVYPEIDVVASPVSIVPDAPGQGRPAEYRFRIANRGRMPTRVFRWMLVAGTTVLAQGDTAVAAQDSLSLKLTLAAPLPAGQFPLRLVADTLGVVHEMREDNNGTTRDLVVLPAPVAVSERPLTLALSNPFPNPSHGRAVLRLELPRPSRVEFSVHDLQGRELWSDGGRLYPAGRFDLAWMQRTSTGNTARPGLYFAQVLVDGRRFVRRLAILR
jgi:glucose/arabinose dehydrogenase